MRVRLAREGARVVAVLQDDGRGFSPREEGAAGLGVPGMHERAPGVGGSLCVESRPGCGTTVRLMVPLDEAGPEGGGRR